MSSIPLTLSTTAFPVNTSWTVEQFHQFLVASITAATTSENVMLGRIGGTMPTGNIGPWLNGTTWYAWNGVTYKPAIIKIGDGSYQITLAADALSANRTITFPDASGTVALTTDINRVTVNPTLGPTVTLDWSLSSSFAIPLNQNISIAHTNSLSGQEIQVAIYNPATGSPHPAADEWQVAWPGVQWTNRTVPVQSVNDKLDMYWIRNMGGNLYGRVLPNY